MQHSAARKVKLDALHGTKLTESSALVLTTGNCIISLITHQLFYKKKIIYELKRTYIIYNIKIYIYILLTNK